MSPSALSLIAFCLWALIANIGAFLPSRRRHWPLAYVLLVTGPPLLAWVAATQPLPVTLICALATISMLRWPIRFGLRWLAQRLGRTRRTTGA